MLSSRYEGKRRNTAKENICLTTNLTKGNRRIRSILRTRSILHTRPNPDHPILRDLPDRGQQENADTLVEGHPRAPRG